MSSKTPLLLKSLCLAALAIVLLLAGYWVKCQLGMNIIPGFEWEKHFPFLNSFQKIERVIRPAPGKAFTSTFDELLPFYDWSAIWARDAGAVHAEIVTAGLHNSKALRIRSASTRDWAFQSSIRFDVSPGDTFEFSGYARTTADARSHMSVIFYDAFGKVTKWDGVSTAIRAANWRLYANRLVVPEGTARIRFRIAGSGTGESYFDDVSFLRIR